MSNTQQQVENYLKHDRTLLGGRNLYNKLPGKSLAVQNSLARFTNTPQNLERLYYELAKLAGITERTLKIITQQPVVQVEAEAEEPKQDPAKELSPEDKLIAFNAETSDYNASKALLKDLEIKTPNLKKKTVLKALTTARKELVNKKLAALPQEIKASVKLRDQFPFLRKPDCPSVLKVLVADLITNYETFKANQPKLHDLLDAEAAKTLVDTVKDNYIANKQAYAELEHYQTTSNILGEHPIFERLQQKEAITKLSTAHLTKKIHNLTTNLNRNRKANNAELAQRDEELLAHAEAELAKR